jgi:tRNA(Ile)-lysidine synthase
MAERLRADADALDQLAAQERERLRSGDGLDARGLQALPAALRARVLAAACPVPLESVHLEALARLCADTSGTRSIDLPGGVVAERIYGRLGFGRPLADPGDAAIVVDGPGRF